MSKGLQFCLGALLLICTSVTTAGGLEPLPPGIPATTSNRNLCFNSQELEAYDANYPRIAVSGCSVGAIRPSTDVNSYRVYRDDTGGSVIDCQTTRANEFNTRFLDNFLKEVSTMADDTVRDPSATNALCISNMLYSWASADAMKNVKTRADSSSSQSKYDRMWVVGGLAATYLKNQHIQDRAAKLAINSSNKDAAIKKWLLDLGRKISAEIDENRHKGHEANIQYWRAFAILSIGLLNRDKNLLSQSQEVFQTAMSSITDDPNRPEDDYGFLPFELERRSKALHYHGFASEPILGMALVSKMYGCHFLNSHWRLNQISRLLRKTIQGKYQPEVFTNEIERVFGAKGVTQDSSSDSRRLTYLANEINPAISKNVTEFIARLANATLSTTYGHDKGNPRLGGSYQRLVEAVNLRKTTYSNLLGEVCGGMDYPLNSYRIVLNEPIRSPIVPALRSTKGRIISCNSATPLPVGLSLNSSTCAITGTSRMVQTAASYIINAIVDNPTYEVVTKISIEVQPAQYTKIFSCSKNDSNGGCRVNAKCDAADIIVSTKMACNLESSSLNSDILNSIPKDRLVVVTPSEKVNDGICNLSPGGFVRSGSLALDLAPLKTGSTTASCRELDSNGGDCKLIIQLTCQRNKVVGFD